MIDLGYYVVTPSGKIGLVTASDVPYHPNGRNFCVRLAQSPKYICEWHHVSKLVKSNFDDFFRSKAL